jgi:2-desacetyl-2-hydroxyethyl bacteriochlorophyllide A dehydrogenase
MRATQVVFAAPGQAGWERVEIDEALQPTEALLGTRYSLICPGTELWALTELWGEGGVGEWTPPPSRYPFPVGYTGVCEILDVGSAVTDFRPGDMVFAYGARHASHAKVDITREGIPYLKVPREMDLRYVPFVRLAAIAITALRVSEGELGDFVAVQGLGLVGNLAAQLFRLAGFKVIGIDTSEGRLAAARNCGIKRLVNPATVPLKDAVMELTGGAGCEVSVDAIGNPSLIKGLCEITGRLGEVILLGSPRGRFETDVTPLLNHVHLWPMGSLTFKGAHEWRFPLYQAPGTKHSLERNSRIIFDLITEGQLLIEPLITHVLPAEKAAEAYDGLLNHKDRYLGVLFDWNEGGKRAR